MPDSPLYSYLMNLGPIHLLPSNGLKLKSHLSKHLHRSSVLEQHTESLTADVTPDLCGEEEKDQSP